MGSKEVDVGATVVAFARPCAHRTINMLIGTADNMKLVAGYLESVRQKKG